MNRRYIFSLCAVVALVAACATAEQESTTMELHDAQEWDDLLRRHAREGGLDYAALAQDRALLDRYLASVAATDASALGPDDRLAFWINAYNAGVAMLVLDRYPGVRSVKDVDGFFDELTFEVAGMPMTLDEVEGRSRESGDPRIHFAVVCASTSCPDLRDEAFVGDRLDEQLEEQTRRFLADESKGLRFDADADELHLSSIFKWYAGDFTGGSTVVAFFARSKVAAWVLDYLPEGSAGPIRAADPAIRYMDYDWSLNDR
jgi:hypothetical protein